MTLPPEIDREGHRHRAGDHVRQKCRQLDDVVLGDQSAVEGWGEQFRYDHKNYKQQRKQHYSPNDPLPMPKGPGHEPAEMQRKGRHSWWAPTHSHTDAPLNDRTGSRL